MILMYSPIDIWRSNRGLVDKSGVRGGRLLAQLRMLSVSAVAKTNKVCQKPGRLGPQVGQAVRLYHRLMLLVALLMVLYWHVITGLARQWSDDANFSYGFVIPWVSGYLIWKLRPKLATIRPHPAGTGLLIVFMSLIML